MTTHLITWKLQVIAQLGVDKKRLGGGLCKFRIYMNKIAIFTQD